MTASGFAKLGFAMLVLVGCTPDQLTQTRSDHTAPIGTVFKDQIQVGRSTVPLPPGEWTLAAAGVEKSGRIDGGMRSDIVQIRLVKLSPSRTTRQIEGFITASANLTTNPVEWSRFPSCERTDWLHVNNQWKGNQDQFCMYVRAWATSWRYGQDWSQIDRSAVEWAQSNNIALSPVTFLQTYYRFVRYSDLLNVTYFQPTRELGVSYNTSEADWHPVSRRSRSDLERAFTTHLSWSESWVAQVRAGFEGKLTRQVIAPTTSAPQTPSTTPDRATRLKELMELRQGNLISEEEFQTRRSRILEGL